MKCSRCACEWWIEQRLVQLVRVPEDARLQSLPKATKYRLVCAQCSQPAPTEMMKEN